MINWVEKGIDKDFLFRGEVIVEWWLIKPYGSNALTTITIIRSIREQANRTISIAAANGTILICWTWA
jgi:hypothetical protein